MVDGWCGDGAGGWRAVARGGGALAVQWLVRCVPACSQRLKDRPAVDGGRSAVETPCFQRTGLRRSSASFSAPLNVMRHQEKKSCDPTVDVTDEGGCQMDITITNICVFIFFEPSRRSCPIALLSLDPRFHRARESHDAHVSIPRYLSPPRPHHGVRTQTPFPVLRAPCASGRTNCRHPAPAEPSALDKSSPTHHPLPSAGVQVELPPRTATIG